MRKVDLENMIDSLNKLKAYTDKMNYNDSTYINTHLITVLPVLQKELNRLEGDDIELGSPAIKLFSPLDSKDKQSITQCMNAQLSELVSNECKIIDFGIQEINNTLMCYIKYIK